MPKLPLRLEKVDKGDNPLEYRLTLELTRGESPKMHLYAVPLKDGRYVLMTYKYEYLGLTGRCKDMPFDTAQSVEQANDLLYEKAKAEGQRMAKREDAEFRDLSANS